MKLRKQANEKKTSQEKEVKKPGRADSALKESHTLNRLSDILNIRQFFAAVKCPDDYLFGNPV